LVLAAPKGAAPAKSSLPSKAAVFVSSVSDSDAAKIESDLTKALEDQSVPLIDVTAEFPSTPRDDAGEKLAKEAKQAYDDLDYEGSAAKWASALEFFVKHPEAADAKNLADAHFFIGALAIQNGGKSQMKKGTEEFVRALLHNPELTCDPQIYGNDVKKAFDKATAEVNTKATAKVTVESTPGGADVELRGKNVGTTPLNDLPNVPVGRHLLVFSKAGYEPTGVYADVSREGASVKPELKAAPGFADVHDGAINVIAKGVGQKGALPGPARKLADIIKARFLVLSDGATAEVWDTESGNRLAGLSISSEELTATAKKIGAFIAKPGPAAALVATKEEGPVGTVDETSSGDPVYKKWWFWTAVGVVAVGGAATAVGVAANNSSGRPFNVVLGTP
jgi:hypothetical protein